MRNIFITFIVCVLFIFHLVLGYAQIRINTAPAEVADTLFHAFVILLIWDSLMRRA